VSQYNLSLIRVNDHITPVGLLKKNPSHCRYDFPERFPERERDRKCKERF